MINQFSDKVFMNFSQQSVAIIKTSCQTIIIIAFLTILDTIIQLCHGEITARNRTQTVFGAAIMTYGIKSGTIDTRRLFHACRKICDVVDNFKIVHIFFDCQS